MSSAFEEEAVPLGQFVQPRAARVGDEEADDFFAGRSRNAGPTWTGFHVAILVLVAAAVGGAVTAAILSGVFGSDNKSKNNNIIGSLDEVKSFVDPNQTCGNVFFDVECTLRNVIRHNQTAGAIPADPIAATGDDTDGGRILVMNNQNLTIIHKNTFEKLFSAGLQSFFETLEAPFDPYVIWDDYHKRFFLVAWYNEFFDPDIRSFMFVAVSKTAAPSDAGDFFTYGPVENAPYNTSITDFPKISVDDRALYISTADFLGPDGDTADIVALDKADLMDGTGITILWQEVLPPPGGSPGLLFPVERRLPSPDLSQPMFFAGVTINPFFGQVPPATIMRFFMGTADGLDPTPIDVDLPTPVSMIISSNGAPTARQPPPAIPIGMATVTWPVMTGVVYKDRLFLAHGHNISEVQTLVRWYEFDVSQATTSRQITLLQWSDIDVNASVDTFIPHLDVNKHGDMCIGFSMSGTDQFVVPAYTCRLRTDPLNTIRYPIQIAINNEFTYFENNGGPRNRWGDYSSMQIDPSDGETFWGCNMRPDPVGLFGPPFAYGYCNKTTTDCIARDYTMDLWNFQISNDPCEFGLVTEPRQTIGGARTTVALSTEVSLPAVEDFEIPDGVRPSWYPTNGTDDDDDAFGRGAQSHR